MLELSSIRKSKVNLADYSCKQDIENRILLADSSPFDLSVLEEILFSPLKISLKKLVRNVGGDEDAILAVLTKLSQTGLLSIQEDVIVVDKETRKYFETQIRRFSPDFKPDMEFFQELLKKVPIHVLPAWFSIPRTSNNIFESIIEKSLLTPQIFQRYLQDLNFTDPLVHRVIADLFSEPSLQVQSSDLIAKYNLDRRHFEEIALLLEFHFIGCLSYRKEEGHWVEILTPFHEWRQYLRFLSTTEAPPLDPASVKRFASSGFAFVETMASLLVLLYKKPLSKEDASSLVEIVSCSTVDARPFLNQAIHKLLLLQLAEEVEGLIRPSKIAKEWLSKKKEDQALFLYQHGANQILQTDLPSRLNAERYIREAEKSVRRVLHQKWVLFDDFFQGVQVSLSEESVISLKKIGKHYAYVLPTYTQDEKNLLKATLFEWLFEAGMVAIGSYQNKDCFAVTAFGCLCFED